MLASKIVPMRMQTGDCVIAALATALQRSYESVAAMLGVELDGEGIPRGETWPWHPDQDPMMTLADMCERLTKAGEHPSLAADLPPVFIEIIVAAARCPAVLIVLPDDPIDQGKAHALAYRDGRTVDCRTATDDDRQPCAALIFAEPNKRRSSRRRKAPAEMGALA